MNTNTKYRRKTYEIDAFQIMNPQGSVYTGVWPTWLLLARSTGAFFMNWPIGADKYIYILKSGKRLQIVNEGDWITRGENGSLSVVPDEEFRATHEPVPAPELNPNHDRHSFMKFLRSDGIEDLSLDDRIETFLNILPNGQVITKDLLDKLLEDYNVQISVGTPSTESNCSALHRRISELEDGLRQIALWKQEDQDNHETCILQWRGCVAIARRLLKPNGYSLAVTDLDEEDEDDSDDTFDKEMADLIRKTWDQLELERNPFWCPWGTTPTKDDPEYQEYQEFLMFVDNLMGARGKPRKDRKS